MASVLDDGDFPTLKVGNADTVTEGGSSVFPVQVVGITKDTVRVWWHTVDGSAKAGLDYTADSGVVTFLVVAAAVALPSGRLAMGAARQHQVDSAEGAREVLETRTGTHR